MDLHFLPKQNIKSRNGEEAKYCTVELCFLYNWCKLETHWRHGHKSLSSISTWVFQLTSVAAVWMWGQFDTLTAQQHQGELFIIPGNEDCKPVCIPQRVVIQCVQRWQRTFPFCNISITLSERLSLRGKRHDTRPGSDASSTARGCSISTFCSTHTFI